MVGRNFAMTMINIGTKQMLKTIVEIVRELVSPEDACIKMTEPEWDDKDQWVCYLCHAWERVHYDQKTDYALPWIGEFPHTVGCPIRLLRDALVKYDSQPLRPSESRLLRDLKILLSVSRCGDNSCVVGSPGGMATNGGCRCDEVCFSTIRELMKKKE